MYTVHCTVEEKAFLASKNTCDLFICASNRNDEGSSLLDNHHGNNFSRKSSRYA